jgi:multidrug transporter EmrE-like cation transporter
MNYIFHLVMGTLYGIIAQIITFLQLQGNIKWGWLQKYPILTLLASIPMGYLFIKSVEHFVAAYNGAIWPSRLIGFAIGIIVFALMSFFLFKEPINAKTIVCLILSCCILGVQIFWK